MEERECRPFREGLQSNDGIICSSVSHGRVDEDERCIVKLLP